MNEDKYIATDGSVVDVKTLNNFHLVNSLVKNAGVQAVLESSEVLTNVRLLKAEILDRLSVTPM
jgi:hypothetical protein